MKIKSLQFYDYRFFYAEKESDKKDYFIDIDSKNLLIYGENGSGKSSFFFGIKDIVNQEDFTSHFKTSILNDGYLEITFDDNSTDKFDASGISASKLELLNMSKLNSFLSYRELLRTHFLNDSEINFFDLIVNDILKEHNLKTLGKLQHAWKSLEGKNIEREKKEIENSVPNDLSEEEAKEQIEILEKNFEEKITKFNDELDDLLKTINIGINEIVKSFNQGISLSFELEELTRENFLYPKLLAKVEFAESNLMSFHKFLNEARLSAIAISIYLTALQTNPTVGAIKFIFLDDIFLGLDLSNRLPLLDILKEEFSEWQIFLTTYDRHWFEVAKQHLESSKWKTIEMYAAKVEGKSFEKPIIIQSEDYYARAEKYFKAGDYPAALNYLRKELESLIKERLPEELIRHFDERPHQLVHLWDLLIEKYNRNKQGGLVTDKIKSDLKVIRLSLLNPQSHDNLSAPVYKYELERAFGLIKEIQAIPIIQGVTLMAAGMKLVFKHPSLDYSMLLELQKDWKVDIVGTSKTHVYPKCKIIHWQYNKSDYFDTFKNIPGNKPDKFPEDNLNSIRSKLIKQPILQPLTEETFNANTTFEDIWSVKELLERCENKRKNSWFCRIFKKE